MMYEEFEKIAGYEVSFDDYDKIIEPMYMATNLSKQEFVKCIDKKRFALKTRTQMVNAIKKIAQHLAETCEDYTDFDSKHEMEKLIRECEKRFGGDWIVSNQYTYPVIKRGHTYPEKIFIYLNNHFAEEIVLVDFAHDEVYFPISQN